LTKERTKKNPAEKRENRNITRTKKISALERQTPPLPKKPNGQNSDRPTAKKGVGTCMNLEAITVGRGRTSKWRIARRSLHKKQQGYIVEVLLGA